MNTSSPLISAADAMVLFYDPRVVIIDARGGEDARQRYHKSHVEGAVFFDLETQLSKKGEPAKGGRHPLPDPAMFGRLLGKSGITPDSHIVVYDDKAGANAAARFWWMMKALGHEKVNVVDGGLAALQRAGASMSSREPATITETPAYPAQAWLLPLASIDEVDQVRQKDDWLVIDVRENFRFRGESEPIDLVAGHIPGAVNVPYINNLEANGNFKSGDAIAGAYRDVIGDRDSRRVIMHCGSGVTACHSILAMASAGLSIPKLYVGSWSEWSRNEKPVATGEKA